MDLNEIVEDKFNRVMNKYISSKETESYKINRDNLREIIKLYDNENNWGKIQSFNNHIKYEENKENSLKKECFIKELSVLIVGKIPDYELKLLLFNCEKFYNLERIELLTNNINDYLYGYN
jgi:predicted ATPase